VSTSRDVVDDILDALVPLDVRAIPMFGAHGLYCNEKFVGLVSQGHLYIKYSNIEPALVAGTEPAPPFPGAKDWYRVPPALLANDEWLRLAIEETAAALPFPKPKKRMGKRDGPVM
jgi:TfoX/Sxy family transcriptional regulator of competence genes